MTLSETEFFCVKCRCTVKLPSSNISVKVYKNARFINGSPALVGKCNKCGTNVTKFICHNDKDKLEKKYGKCTSTAKKSPKKSPKKTVDKKCLEKCVKKCTK